MSTNEPPAGSHAAAEAGVRAVLQASRVAQMMYVMAELGLPELLADGPRPADDLAVATGAHAPSLYRLLRALAAAGFVTQEPGQRFALTARGAVLRPDAPGELAAQVRIQLSEPRWRPWGNLLASVRSGRSTFHDIFGMSDWEYQARHPELADHFNAFMSRRSTLQQAAIVAAYDFSRFGTVVDVGGGQGQLLAEILRANPGTRGILFDQPEVVRGADAILDTADLRGRCTIIGGSFLEAVPAGGDAYLLKSILHNWDDAPARDILRNVHDAMAPGGTLLLLERVLPEEQTLELGEAIADLTMLVILQGKERTEREFAALLDATGFRLERVVPTGADVGIVEGTRR